MSQTIRSCGINTLDASKNSVFIFILKKHCKDQTRLFQKKLFKIVFTQRGLTVKNKSKVEQKRIRQDINSCHSVQKLSINRNRIWQEDFYVTIVSPSAGWTLLIKIWCVGWTVTSSAEVGEQKYHRTKALPQQR